MTPQSVSCAFAVTAVQQTDLGEARVHSITAQSFCRSCGAEWVSLVGRSSMLLTCSIIVRLLQDLHLSLVTFHKICFCRYVKIKISNNVEQPSGKFVYDSARARCLAQSAVDEQVLLYLNNGCYISAVEYRVGCNEQPTKLPSDWSQPQQVVVLCRFPETAEPLRQTATPGDHSKFLGTHAI